MGPAAGAEVWRNMSFVQKAPFQRQAEIASAKYKAEKKRQDSQTVVYSLTSAGQAAAAKLRKRAIATAAAKTCKAAKAPTVKKAPTTKPAGKATAKKATVKRPNPARVRSA